MEKAPNILLLAANGLRVSIHFPGQTGDVLSEVGIAKMQSVSSERCRHI